MGGKIGKDSRIIKGVKLKRNARKVVLDRLKEKADACKINVSDNEKATKVSKNTP